MHEVILYVGLGLFMLGAMGFLVAAFKTHLLWGLAVLFISPVALFYLLAHWQDAKSPFKLQLLGLLLVGVFAYINGGVSLSAPSNLADAEISKRVGIGNSSVKDNKFICDGRQHCRQMRSRAEARFFVKNCPNTKMDGDRDGVPCENDTRF